MSLVERLQRRVHTNLHEPGFENLSAHNILIYARNEHIPPNEIVHEAMLLVSPPATTVDSMSLSPMAVAGRTFTEREAVSSQMYC